MGDSPNLVSAPRWSRLVRVKAAVISAFVLTLCLMLAGATRTQPFASPALLISGMTDIPSPPKGSSWAPDAVDGDGVRMIASTDRQQFQVHTAGGDRIFLPGVDLGGTTPGHAADELSISAAQYRAWFAAMSWLGIRVVRIYTLHPPAFYQQLEAYNRANPQRPLYLMQGVALPDDAYRQRRNLYDRAVTSAFQQELRDASAAVSGDLTRPASTTRASGTWTADVTDWLIGWIIGTEIDPYAGERTDKRNADAPAVSGRYFRTTGDATGTERWLAARMNELAGLEAKRGLSQPIAFVNSASTDPLRHPDEPLRRDDLLQLDANHVRPTADWPAGTFASYHAYPFAPDFLRRERGLQQTEYGGRLDPYAGYLAALRRHHPDMPTLITEFGVPSSIGSAHNGPLGRGQGDHSEPEAMQIDADLLRLINDQGLAGGFLFEWADEWFRSSANTAAHQNPDRRQLWHDPFTSEQHYGLLAVDATGTSRTTGQELTPSGADAPATRVTAQVDEAYVHLRIALGDRSPDSLTLGFDVLPDLTGTPFPGSTDRRWDAVLALNLVARAGQAYLRDRLDPLPLDVTVPPELRGRAPAGWQPYELIVKQSTTAGRNRAELPPELQNAGLLRYGGWNPDAPDSDSRALWHRDGNDLIVRIPWALLGFADPSSREVGVLRTDSRRVRLETQVSPRVNLWVSTTGSVQDFGQLTWGSWNRPYYGERLKQGAGKFRDAAVAVAP